MQMLEYLYSSEARKHRLNEVVVGRLECWKGKKERGEEGFCHDDGRFVVIH